MIQIVQLFFAVQVFSGCGQQIQKDNHHFLFIIHQKVTMRAIACTSSRMFGCGSWIILFTIGSINMIFVPEKKDNDEVEKNNFVVVAHRSFVNIKSVLDLCSGFACFFKLCGGKEITASACA